MKKDYYEALDVARDIDGPSLKKAYRRLAMKYHPDRNPGDSEAEGRFKEIKEAYEVLSDSSKRATYDQYGHAGLEGGAGMGGGGGAGFGDVFNDVFGDIFGGRAGGQRTQRGADLRYTLELDLEEAVGGTTVKIRIPTRVSCSDCGGSGARKGSKPVTCKTCNGVGQVRMQQGFFSIQQACPHCHGRGSTISDPCGTCRGQGHVQKEKSLSVKVPAGVDNGDRIRLAGEGEAGERGVAAGDLYVDIQVRPHPIFSREDNHLYCEVPIAFVKATLGGQLEVPTLNGRVKLKIPSGTQTGKLFRLRGKGVRPVRGGDVGDLVCRVVVETPVRLNEKQKEMLRNFGDSMEKNGNKHSPKASSWLDGVKTFFEGMKS